MVSFFKLYSYITLHKNPKIVIKMFRKRHLISDTSVSSFHSVNLLPILIPVASPEPQIHLSDRISLYLVTTILEVRKKCSVDQTAGGQRFIWGNGQFSLFFPPHWVACRILVPQPGWNPHPQQWKLLTTGLPEKSPNGLFSSKDNYNEIRQEKKRLFTWGNAQTFYNYLWT